MRMMPVPLQQVLMVLMVLMVVQRREGERATGDLAAAAPSSPPRETPVRTPRL